MLKIFETIKSCSVLHKEAEEGIIDYRMSQLQSIISNNLNSLTTIEQLYVGLEMVLVSLEKVLGYAEEKNIMQNYYISFPRRSVESL